jgi:acyl transferase domain-containing protein
MNTNVASYINNAIDTNSRLDPIDLAYTLAERKSRFPWVTALRANNLKELANRLAEPDQKPSRATKTPRLGFVFNGQGAQWHAMGRELIDAFPVFRSSLLEADQILKDYGATWSLHGMTCLPKPFGLLRFSLLRFLANTEQRSYYETRKQPGFTRSV